MATEKLLWKLPGERKAAAAGAAAATEPAPPLERPGKKRPRPSEKASAAAPSIDAKASAALSPQAWPGKKRPRPSGGDVRSEKTALKTPVAAEPKAASAAAGRGPPPGKTRKRPPKKPSVQRQKDTPERSARRIELNNELAEHAKLKRLDGAAACLARAEAENLDNEFTWSIAINAYVRCGDAAGAEKLLTRMKRDRKIRPGVVAYTSLLKGFCAAGEVPRAETLLQEMAAARAAPNVRTVNTFLRGCVHSGDADRAAACLAAMEKQWGVAPDASTFEMAAQLLCQALRIAEARDAVIRLRSEACDWSSLAVASVAVARAAALLGRREDMDKAVKEASAALNANEREEERDGGGGGGGGGGSTSLGVGVCDSAADDAAAGGAKGGAGKAIGGVGGGKRAWKDSDARAASGRLFAAHRRDALRLDLKQLRSFAGASGRFGELDLAAEQRRLLSFDGDGRGGGPPLTSAALYDLLRQKFGAAARGTPAGTAAAAALAGAIGSDHRLDFARLFAGFDRGNAGSAAATPARKAAKLNLKQEDPEDLLDLKLEVCCGDGSWAIEQAASDVGRSRWCALDMRHDRCHKAWAGSVLRGLSNLLVLAGDAASFLERRVVPGTFSNVFVNFPEPPQQSNDGLRSDASHLLTADFFLLLRRVLRPGGALTVLTDSLWYGRLLLATLSQLPMGTFEPVAAAVAPAADASAAPGSSRSFVGASGSGGVQHVSVSAPTAGGLVLYSGTPPPAACGAPVPGASSYFDRLKAKEKGQRGQQQNPYFLCLQRPLGSAKELEREKEACAAAAAAEKRDDQNGKGKRKKKKPRQPRQQQQNENEQREHVGETEGEGELREGEEGIAAAATKGGDKQKKQRKKQKKQKVQGDGAAAAASSS